MSGRGAAAVEKAPEATDAAALDAEVTVHRPGGFTLAAHVVAEAGQIVAVMGPSGAGKSTLLTAIAGLVAIDAGQVRLGGEVLSSPRLQVSPARRGTVLLGQDPRLFPHLTARDNVAFGPRAHGVSARSARATADGWLARVGLPGAGDRRPAELSGGQQQRVALARALAASPRLVLLDEPLTSLDPVTADGIRTILAARLGGVTCVVVTHDAVDAVALADRLVVLEDGRVTQSGAVRDVLTEPATAFAASIGGLHRVVGVTRGGACEADGVRLGGGAFALADGSPVAAVFPPSAVRISSAADADGSTWAARVVRLEQTVGGVRVHTASPAIAADLAVADVAAQGIGVGDRVRVSVAASAVRLIPA